tara:strand:+ start:5029 stop:5283 length:255 start_codon:yes stop_codon:yes gene_type:complete
VSKVSKKLIEATVTNPPHYRQGDIECIEAIKAACGEDGYDGYLQGNIIKYIWRFKHKGRAQDDLGKARWYLNELIKVYHGDENE